MFILVCTNPGPAQAEQREALQTVLGDACRRDAVSRLEFAVRVPAWQCLTGLFT
ncbi:hypothetical protein IFR09_11930 [Pseudomonas syringae]|nr:hypothetical protein [Pseudomonas syringae]MBD8577159.1 hypothetical protein [Pseudomonas syringae]MBD8792767.1 hypothetical protein [Pseudomonas syringae]MBD8803270.1 hypothetical protein [Pseudomonas syringae]MBD8811867.1 hypothetical protein [Pseudomonas syringae]